MCAFGACLIKEVSRSKLCAAAKAVMPKEESRALRGVEKNKLLKPLAKVFLEKNIVTIEEGADIENLTRGTVTKVGTF